MCGGPAICRNRLPNLVLAMAANTVAYVADPLLCFLQDSHQERGMPHIIDT